MDPKILFIVAIIIIIIALYFYKKENIVIRQPVFFPSVIRTVPLQLPNLIGVWEAKQSGSFAGYYKVHKVSADEYQSYNYDITTQAEGEPAFRFRIVDHGNIIVSNPTENIGSFNAVVKKRNPLKFGGLSYEFELVEVN